MRVLVEVRAFVLPLIKQDRRPNWYGCIVCNGTTENNAPPLRAVVEVCGCSSVGEDGHCVRGCGRGPLRPVLQALDVELVEGLVGRPIARQQRSALISDRQLALSGWDFSGHDEIQRPVSQPSVLYPAVREQWLVRGIRATKDYARPAPQVRVEVVCSGASVEGHDYSVGLRRRRGTEDVCRIGSAEE